MFVLRIILCSPGPPASMYRKYIFVLSQLLVFPLLLHQKSAKLLSLLYNEETESCLFTVYMFMCLFMCVPVYT